MKSMKWYHLVIIAIIIVGIIGTSIFIFQKPKSECPNGFTKDNYECVTEKTNFECTGNVISPKGYYICEKFINNYNESPLNISFVNELVNENKTVHVSGKIWQGFTPCTSDYGGAMGCNINRSYIDVESIQIV